MNINIVTITGEANYGNSLQNYAVRKVLENLGNTVFTLKTQYEPKFTLFSRHNLKQYAKIVLKKSNYYCFIRKIKFKKFSNKYLNKTPYVINEKKPELLSNCDLIVFGSDQIWNFTWGGRLCDGINFYTGGFNQEIPKIAFSASIGADYIPDDKMELFLTNISKFNAISVREEQAKTILDKIIENEVTVTIDPTLMISKQEWMRIQKKPSYVKENEKFILTYFLGKKTSSVDSYIEKYARITNCKIINLYNEYEKAENIKSVNDFCIDPQEFIWLVNNSQMVFTDSFHGSVFSIIFEKNFRCFQRSKEVENMSSRMDTLFSLMQIDSWCKGSLNENFDAIQKYDYTNVASIIKMKQEFVNDYLSKELSKIN